MFYFNGHNCLSELDAWPTNVSAELLLFAPALNMDKLQRAFVFLQDEFGAQGIRLQYKDGLGVVAYFACDELPDNAAEQVEILAVSEQVEVMILDQQPDFSKPGLLVMDMDSTLIQVECIDEIAHYGGVGEQVSEVTELAMQGKLDFAQSLIQRVGCLKNLPVDVLEKVRHELPLMPGIVELVSTFKARGWKIAIASGGFLYFADYLKTRLGLDSATANELEIKDDALTGKVLGDIVDAQAKADCVSSLASAYQIPLSQTVAMGDGANDLVMMKQAALGVAFHAKPVVRQQADVAIRFGGLDLLRLLMN